MNSNATTQNMSIYPNQLASNGIASTVPRAMRHHVMLVVAVVSNPWQRGFVLHNTAHWPRVRTTVIWRSVVSRAGMIQLRLKNAVPSIDTIFQCWLEKWWTYLGSASREHAVVTILTLYVLSFIRGNIKIYLYFVSFLHIDMTQVPKILAQVRPGPTYST